ncbi:carboxylesterase/lipase family protein [Jiangella asiatica]|uniref:Carboxylic ester hydrolase n=1 Tax=Jiangella asiatica TaxID=2530372 RepID=A0A4R5DG96_9ACTN|nr:carboxylesterase family protein [Jiangella asiatica]TDE12996.1 carboxylesterase family protein [Jiangella asiatica]
MQNRALARSLIAAAAVAATSLAASVVAPPAAAGQPPDPGVIRVDSGWLRGSVADDHVTYSAIPYAAPPVGERRWRAPAPPRPWSGVRDATEPSTRCPQGDPANLVGAEDCLYLDVTVPRDARPGARLPVLVWLHGGGFNSGSAQEFDGARLAVSGDLIVVTPNYRLGALGFLASSELEAGGGNYGLMDQAAVLRWVRRNAARFGGDPGNVTLAGQSAGARSVCAHLAAPMSRGLFHRAISQSGACDNQVPTLAEAHEFGDRAAAELGCSTADDVAACLRQRTPGQLLDTLDDVGWEVDGRVSDRPWNPVAGTPVLPRQPGEALRDGSAARVPLLIGGTRDEMRGFVLREAGLTADGYRTMMTGTFGDEADAVLAAYPAADYDSPALALAAVLGDWGGSIGACPVLRSAEAAAARQPVFAYEFAEDSGQAPGGYPLGSYHGLDLPYVWDLDLAQNPYPDLTAEQERMSETIIGYWSAFADTGDPNGAGRPHWPAFGTTGTVIELSTAGIAPTPFADDHRCDLWAGLPR